MKTLLISALSAVIALNAYADEAGVEGVKDKLCAFSRPGENGTHLLIGKHSDLPDKDSFLLYVEPGCILLEVKQQDFTDVVCTLKIVGSPGGQLMIDNAKKILGVTSEIFDIRYVVQKQEGEGFKFPPYNKILEVADHKSEQDSGGDS